MYFKALLWKLHHKQTLHYCRWLHAEDYTVKHYHPFTLFLQTNGSSITVMVMFTETPDKIFAREGGQRWALSRRAVRQCPIHQPGPGSTRPLVPRQCPCQAGPAPTDCTPHCCQPGRTSRPLQTGTLGHPMVYWQVAQLTTARRHSLLGISSSSSSRIIRPPLSGAMKFLFTLILRLKPKFQPDYRIILSFVDHLETQNELMIEPNTWCVEV